MPLSYNEILEALANHYDRVRAIETVQKLRQMEGLLNESGA